MRILIVISFFLASAALADEPPVVMAELADMIEEIVLKTEFDINISESTRESVNINRINGRSVCSDDALEDVRTLQEAFNRHPNIRRNFGPFLYSVTTASGELKFIDRDDLAEHGIIEGCMNIYISVQNGQED